MPAPTLESLLIQETQAEIYDAFLSIATAIGLPVTSWQPGDPTRSLYFIESEFLEKLETIVVGFIKSDFLDFATPEWLVQVAKQKFNVDVPDATFAEGDLILTNSGGGVFDLTPGDLTVKSSVSNKTYHNSTGGHLAGNGGVLTVTVVADEAGSDSSAGAGEINQLVTGLLNVTCSNPAALIGLDQQPAATTIAQCRAKLASLSPNGPAAAYEFVALSPSLTGINTIARARAFADSEFGNVTLYVASAGGAVSGPDITAVQAAILKLATPLCITPTTISANPVLVNITYTIWIYQSVNQTTTQIAAAIETALEDMFASRKIGGDIIPPATTGKLYISLIEGTIGDVFPTQTFRVQLSAPAFDIPLNNGDVAELGTLTPTINIIPGP